MTDKTPSGLPQPGPSGAKPAIQGEPVAWMERPSGEIVTSARKRLWLEQDGGYRIKAEKFTLPLYTSPQADGGAEAQQAAPLLDGDRTDNIAAFTHAVPEPVAYSIGRTLHWHEGKGVSNAQLYAGPQAEAPKLSAWMRAAMESGDWLPDANGMPRRSASKTAQAEAPKGADWHRVIRAQSLQAFREWQRATGALPAGSSWIGEVEGLIADAVDASFAATPAQAEANGDEAEAFEQLCREHDIAGTAAARQCEVFWRAGAAFSSRANPAGQGETGRFAVAVDLLTECLAPLEVSAATVESEDGNEAIDTLIGQVRKFCCDAKLIVAGQSQQPSAPQEKWRTDLHTFLDVAAGEGYELGGVDAADLYEAVFPDEYKAALATPLPAQVQPAEQVGEPSASRMEVDSWRRALIQWHEATLAELVENPRGLRQCLSNAARLLLDHPALASPAPQQPVSADVEAALQELETRHCQGRYFDDRDIARVLRAALSQGKQDCDQAFEEQYKCSSRDPSNAGDLAKFRDGWATAINAAATLYGTGDVAAPVGQSTYGEIRQEGWIDGTKAYRDAIRSLGSAKGGET